MKLLFDTSVWVEHLRRDALVTVLPMLRGKFALWSDAVSAAELRAGCRSKAERRLVDRLLSPFENTGRLVAPEAGDYVRAANAISRLREKGKTLSRPHCALLDALIAAVALRIGALVVTLNIDDFAMLASALPFRAETLAGFTGRIGHNA